MSRYFPRPIALTALLAVLAVPAYAQDAAPAQTPTQAPAAEASAPLALPQALQDAGLTEVTSKRGPQGASRIGGRLPDGSRIDAMLDAAGELRGLRLREGAALPQALVERLVPQAVRDSAVFGEMGSLGAVFSGERGVMLAGKDGEGRALRAGFAEDGTLLRFSRGDEDGPRGMMGRDGKGFGDRGFGDRGFDGRRDGKDRGGKDRDGWGHERRDRDRHGPDRWHGKPDHPRWGHAPGADMPPPTPGGQPPAPGPQGALEPARQDALRQALTEAGYGEIGAIMAMGPGAVAQAVNPEGEAVLLELDPAGQVIREVNGG